MTREDAITSIASQLSDDVAMTICYAEGLFSFYPLSQYVVDGRTVYIVKNPFEWTENPWIGEVVRVNAQYYRVTGVETFAHAKPIMRGEPIGLLVEAITQ